jgi:hypothetical protein
MTRPRGAESLKTGLINMGSSGSNYKSMTDPLPRAGQRGTSRRAARAIDPPRQSRSDGIFGRHGSGELTPYLQPDGTVAFRSPTHIVTAAKH